MKKLVLALLIGALCSFQAQPVQAQSLLNRIKNYFSKGQPENTELSEAELQAFENMLHDQGLRMQALEGGEVPFPFGKEIQFPWNDINGIWRIESPTVKAYFSFEVAHNQTGTTILKVLQLDPKSGNVIGEGAGFANQAQKIVRAVMKSRSSNYLVFVRAFRDLKVHNQILKQATVLSVRTFNTPQKSGQEWHFLLRKMSSRPANYRR